MLQKLKPVHWILIGFTSLILISGIGILGFVVYDNFFGEDEIEDAEGENESKDEEELDCDTILLKDNWKTYIDNSGFGYSIRYPDDWQFSEDLMEGHTFWKVSFGPLGNISETAAIFVGEANFHTLDSIRIFFSGMSPPYILGDSEEVLVDISKGTQFKLELTGLPEYKYILYYIPYPYIGINRVFQGNTEESKRRGNCEAEVFYTMIGSYRFGQEYINDECSFSFRYPTSWEIEEEYYYTTAADIEAYVPTIVLKEIGETDTKNWITINPRQSDCDIFITPNKEEIYIGSSKVISFSSSDGSDKCIEAEVSAKDKTGKNTTFHWISFTQEEEIQQIFKHIIDRFEVR